MKDLDTNWALDNHNTFIIQSIYMDITKKLQELDPTLVLHNEGDWNMPWNPLITGYSSFNDAGICTEDGEFLYGLVRILKPKHVLETGTHIGVGAAFIGMALQENLEGDLTTIEFLPEIHNRAKKRINDLNLQNVVTPLLMDVKDFTPTETYKLIFLDTEPQTRFSELLKFFPSLEAGGFIFIHDLHQHMHQIPNQEHGFAWPYGKLPDEIINLVTEDKLRPMHFETPRGLTGFYKPHPNDYKWGVKK